MINFFLKKIIIIEQNQSININNEQIKYILRINKMAKHMRLTVYPSTGLKVTCPCKLKNVIVEKFILQNRNWILSKLKFFKKSQNNQSQSNNRIEYLNHKIKAYKFIFGRVEYFSNMYNINFNKISIKNQKTRWGSCSRVGNLNFNYKILFLPKILADYVIVHEICHLIEFNHSKKFWDLVGIAIPNHKNVRKELKMSKIYLR